VLGGGVGIHVPSSSPLPSGVAILVFGDARGSTVGGVIWV